MIAAINRVLSRLACSRSGVAMTEFALGAPLLLTAGLWGVETANFAVSNMKVSQLALQVADNASRIGDTSTLEERRIYENDINDLLRGADIQGGPAMDLFEHGRVIISSLEVWDNSVHSGASQSDGTQFIHWQRCMGKKVHNSDYGNQNQAIPSGIGPAGQEVSAEVGSPVIFVEIVYDYQPLVSARFLGPSEITAIASFMVRDSRDLSGLLQPNEASPDAMADCNVYNDLG